MVNHPRFAHRALPVFLALLALTFPFGSRAIAQQIDLVFVVDGSSQMSGADFAIAKDWVAGRANELIGVDHWAALVQFAGGTSQIVNLTGSSATFLNGLNTMAQPGGDACLACGLSGARLHLQNFGRQGTCKSIVVITDGNANAPGPDPAAAAQAEADLIIAAGMDLYTVGVGSDRDAAFLTSLARGAGTYRDVESAVSWTQDLFTTCLATPTRKDTWSRLKLMYR